MWFPDVSTTPGAISALRANDAGDRRYLQVTNSLNPGNSGGPLVTRDTSRSASSSRSCARNGDRVCHPDQRGEEPARRPRPRSCDADAPSQARRLQTIDPKGVALRLPEGFADRSPFMSHVETDATAGEVAFRLDRVLSPWAARRVEEASDFDPDVRTEHDDTTAGPRCGETFRARPAARRRGRRVGKAIARSGWTMRSWISDPEARGPRGACRGDGVQRERAAGVVAQPPGSTLRRRRPSFGGQGDLVHDGDASGRGVLPVPAGGARAGPACAVPRDAGAEHGRDRLPGTRRQHRGARGRVAGGCRARRRTGLLVASRVPRSLVLCEHNGVARAVLRDRRAFTRMGPSQVVQLEILATEPRSAFAQALLGIWLKKTTE